MLFLGIQFCLLDAVFHSRSFTLFFMEKVFLTTLLFIYSILMIIACTYKGITLIKKVGEPASANYMDKFPWKIRLIFTFLLVLVFVSLVTGIFGELGIEMSILLIPMILVYL